MTTFDEREKAYEAKFAHDAEMAFKAYARRTRTVGIWAAELIGKTAAETQAYVVDLIHADLEDPKHEATLRKLVTDLEGKADEAAIRAKLDDSLADAKQALANGE